MSERCLIREIFKTCETQHESQLSRRLEIERFLFVLLRFVFEIFSNTIKRGQRRLRSVIGRRREIAGSCGRFEFVTDRLSRRTSLPGRGAHFYSHHMLGGGSDPPQRLHHMLGGGSRPPQHLHHMLGGGSWPRTPPETRGQTLRALDFTPHFAAFSRGKSSFGAT